MPIYKFFPKQFLYLYFSLLVGARLFEEIVNSISRTGNVRDKSGTILWQKAGELKITVVMSKETGLHLKGLPFVKDGTVLEEKLL